MPSNSSFDGIDTFDHISEESILEYIDNLASNKSTNDKISIYANL